MTFKAKKQLFHAVVNFKILGKSAFFFIEKKQQPRRFTGECTAKNQMEWYNIKL